MDPIKNEQAPVRTKDDYFNMSHSVLLNHLKTEVKKSNQKTRVKKITDYLTKRIWAWFYYYVISRFGPNYKYNTYKAPHTGIYPLGDAPVTIALTADWATNTQESAAVAACMQQHHPDYTIHLGDTYYVGAPHEIADNFLRRGSPWIRGAKGSFALLGNHEMYARGVAYYEKLLPSLGIRNAAGHFDGQKAAFFCLENNYWRVLALDTGYHSVGKIPLLELIPWFAPDCHFDDKLIEWLSETIKLDNPADKRGLLILTHHQYITAFNKSGEYTKPAKQLAKLTGTNRPVVWLWGHEHKFSMFEKVQADDCITAYGRCIGHGGMPVELNSKEFIRNPDKIGSSKLVMLDDRIQSDVPGCQLGFNGYALLSLSGADLKIAYHDINVEILSETWTADIVNGIIKGSIKKTNLPDLQPVDGKTWEDAVK